MSNLIPRRTAPGSACPLTNHEPEVTPDTPAVFETPSALPPLDHLLVAVDFSDASLAAVRMGLSLARRTGTTLCVLHVVEITGYAPDTRPAIPREAVTRWWNDGLVRLNQLACWLRSHHEKVATQIRLGLPSEQILQEASSASLLLLGRQPAKRPWSWFSKRTAESILQQCTCPVLLVGANGTDPGFPTSSTLESRE